MAIDPAFRAQITGSPEEKAYDTSSYRQPENPVIEALGVKLAANKEEELLLELLPNVAKPFLQKLRETEQAAKKAAEAPEEKAEEKVEEAPITGPVQKALMGGKIVSVDVKPGDKVKKGQTILVYEAMKMENDVASEIEGTIKRIFVAPGDIVNTDQIMVEFE